jgi:hypothetical protein
MESSELLSLDGLYINENCREIFTTLTHFGTLWKVIHNNKCGRNFLWVTHKKCQSFTFITCLCMVCMDTILFTACLEVAREPADWFWGVRLHIMKVATTTTTTQRPSPATWICWLLFCEPLRLADIRSECQDKQSFYEIRENLVFYFVKRL